MKELEKQKQQDQQDQNELSDIGYYPPGPKEPVDFSEPVVDVEALTPDQYDAILCFHLGRFDHAALEFAELDDGDYRFFTSSAEDLLGDMVSSLNVIDKIYDDHWVILEHSSYYNQAEHERIEILNKCCFKVTDAVLRERENLTEEYYSWDSWEDEMLMNRVGYSPILNNQFLASSTAYELEVIRALLQEARWSY